MFEADRVLARMVRFLGAADVAVTTQNPTIRADGPANNPDARRVGGTARMGQLSAWARARGLGVIDTYTAMTDYVEGCAAGTRQPAAFQPDGTTPGNGTLNDLLDIAVDPQQGGQRGVHPKGYGVNLQALKLLDEATS